MSLALADSARSRGPGRILHVITGLGDGGAEAVLYRLISTDHDHFHEVISLMDVGKYGPLISVAGIRVDVVGMRRGTLSLWGIRRLWKLIRASDAEVVQTWMYHADVVGGIVARLAGKPIVVWGLHHAHLGALRTRLMAGTCAVASRLVPRRIVSCSREAARLHSGLGYPKERIVVIPNGYDLARFSADPDARSRLRSEWSVSEDTVVLGTVARWDWTKDHRTLFGALLALGDRSNANWRCILVGTGMVEGNTELRTLLEVCQLGERVTLLGPRDDIPEVMCALDLHVLSSRAEAFPNVVAEAMACGTPCLVTDVGDAGFIVADTGWVVPAQDPERLSQGLIAAMAAMRNRSAWEMRQRAARNRIEANFSLNAMVRSYSEVWRDAASS